MSIKPFTAALILGGVVATAGTCYLFRKRLNLDKVFEELSQIAKKRGGQISAGVATVGAAGYAVANNKLNNIKGQVAESFRPFFEEINNLISCLRHNQNDDDGDGGVEAGVADGAGAGRAAAAQIGGDAGRAGTFQGEDASTPRPRTPDTASPSVPTPVNRNGNNRPNGNNVEHTLQEVANALMSGIEGTTRAAVGVVGEVKQTAVRTVQKLGNQTRSLLDQGADTVGGFQRAIENPGDLVASEARRLTNVAARKLRNACLYTVGTAGTLYWMYKSVTIVTSDGSGDLPGAHPNTTGTGF